jgi:hypothetical protein
MRTEAAHVLLQQCRRLRRCHHHRSPHERAVVPFPVGSARMHPGETGVGFEEVRPSAGAEGVGHSAAVEAVVVDGTAVGIVAVAVAAVDIVVGVGSGQRPQRHAGKAVVGTAAGSGAGVGSHCAVGCIAESGVAATRHTAGVVVGAEPGQSAVDCDAGWDSAERGKKKGHLHPWCLASHNIVSQKKGQCGRKSGSPLHRLRLRLRFLCRRPRRHCISARNHRPVDGIVAAVGVGDGGGGFAEDAAGDVAAMAAAAGNVGGAPQLAAGPRRGQTASASSRDCPPVCPSY